MAQIQTYRSDKTSLITRVMVWTLVVLYSAVVIRTAWISDDAFITLRTVDNFTHGYGLTWNIDERVQAFTHPLWLFLLSIPYSVTHEPYYTTLFLSVSISLAAGILFTARIPKSAGSALFGLVALTSSRAYIDYSTSGLEGPLTHLILVGFFLVYSSSSPNPKSLFWLCLLGAAATLSRPDILLLISPPLVQRLASTHRHSKSIVIGAAGFAPLLGWGIFSTLYYGFPWPNTAYAKLITGLERSDLLAQGNCYLADSMTFDPVTLPVIGGMILIGISRSGRKIRSMAIGAILYLLYILWIGGDFMSGRLLTPLFLTAVIGITLWTSEKQVKAHCWLLAIGGVCLVGFLAPYPTILSDANYRRDEQWEAFINPDGIADERGFYFQSTGLFRVKGFGLDLEYPWILEGLEFQRYRTKVVVFDSIGMAGYFAGPSVHLIDPIGLADALLSRLPPERISEWRIGHFQRAIPCGYIETLSTGQNVLQDKNLQAYYNHLSAVIRGGLWSRNRFNEIIRLNLGLYQPLLDNYRPENDCKE